MDKRTGNKDGWPVVCTPVRYTYQSVVKDVTNRLLCFVTLLLTSGLLAANPFVLPPDDSPPMGPAPVAQLEQLDGLATVASENWNVSAIRRVLQAFAFGGHATEHQLQVWAAMQPEQAIIEMLRFDVVNPRLSAMDGARSSGPTCGSLRALQEFWGSEHVRNPVQQFDRSYYGPLDEEGYQLNPIGLFLTWNRAMHTRGCNGFLHKTAFYLTNYHASIHIQNTFVALMRDYYDQTVRALANGMDFEGLMYQAARSGALAVAYGHTASYVNPQTGKFYGNDDFAREYFQLLFGIQGTTEDPEYHEGVTIENNARLLSGMLIDVEPDRFGSQYTPDWLVNEIDFSDHTDAAGRQIFNRTLHHDFRLGEASCLEILHEPICGATADDKLRALGPVAAAHPESMASTPLKLIRFFADERLTPQKSAALQAAWADAELDLLHFLRGYAVSTQFHDPARVKHWSSFERNLNIFNATVLDNRESFARPFFLGPTIPTLNQGGLVFAPIRDVFGGQTGNDAANDRYVFKNGWGVSVATPEYLAVDRLQYQLTENDAPRSWVKQWQKVIPQSTSGGYVIEEVAEWLWDRIIADGGAHFDVLARAQVYSLLATGFDFASVASPEDLDRVYSSQDLIEGPASDFLDELAGMSMDFADPLEQIRVGLAVNFISMTPYSFVSGTYPVPEEAE